MNFSQKTIKGLLLFFVFILSAGISFGFIQWFSNNLEQLFYERAIASISDNLQPEVLHVNDRQEGLNMDAESVISVKIQSDGERVLFSKNKGEKLPIASLTKLMTALVILEKYDLDQKVVISESAIKQEGEQGMLKAGEVLSVKNLLYIALIESSNRAAFALSEFIGQDNFIALMNETGQKIGLINTRFKDSTGLDPGSYSTSQDLVKLTKHLFENYPLFKEIIGLKEFDLYLPDGQFHHKLMNTNKFLGQVQGVVGGKTGWTDMAKGCFMIIQESPERGSYFVNIILGAQDRFLEMEKLINWVNTNYRPNI